MATYCKCGNCGHTFRLPFKARSEVPEPYLATCPRCKRINVCSQSDVIEHGVQRFKCPVCGKRLFVEAELPRTVRCPLCGSVLKVERDKVTTLREGDKVRPLIVAAVAALLLGRGKNVLTLALLTLGALKGSEVEAELLD